MTDATKVGAAHLQRAAYVYLRQSTPHQVVHNCESTEQQYGLVSKATNLGWPSRQIVVIDEDLGLPGTGIAQRNGFAQLTAEVADAVHRRATIRATLAGGRTLRTIRTGHRREDESMSNLAAHQKRGGHRPHRSMAQDQSIG